MKTLRRSDIESMKQELTVLVNPEKYFGGAKGEHDDPYSYVEYDLLCMSGNWNGGYVEGYGYIHSKNTDSDNSGSYTLTCYGEDYLFYQDFQNQAQLEDYLRAYDHKVEAHYIFYADGTCGFFIHEKNTYSWSTFSLCWNSFSETWRFNGKDVSEWGHTHPTPGGVSQDDRDARDYFGLPSTIWYNNQFNPFE